MERLSWDEYFLKIADAVAERSTCARRKVGAVLVRDRQILATGFAGSIKGAPHCTEVGCLLLMEKSGCQRTIHGEINCILQAAEHGVSIKGASLYCTMSPCLSCFLAIANGGVVRVVYSTEYRTIEPQRTWAREAGLAWEHIGTDKYKPEDTR